MSDTELTARTCQPCTSNTPSLTHAETESLLDGLAGWSYRDGHIERSFSFGNYYETMAFVNAVAWLAHREGHHPDLEVGFRSCKVKYWTHAIDGLSENDFICAAKVSQLTQ